MATPRKRATTAKKPAAQPAAEVEKPATEQEKATVGTKELAQMLGRDQKSLRVSLRRIIDKADQPGQGGRYKFDPDSDEFKQLVAKLKGEKVEA